MRDYVGAVTLLECDKSTTGDAEVDNQLWLGFAASHLSDHHKALTVYRELLKRSNADPMWHLYLAVCQFYLGMYKEAETEAALGPACKLQNRLLFHLSHKAGDEKRLMAHHQALQDVVDDQEFLELYLQQHPDSVIACNLKACNHFKLYNGKAAEQELRALLDKLSPSCRFAQDVIKHNLAVFRSGEGSLQTFPQLVDVLSEARLNLAIYHLRNDDVQAAFDLMKDIEPATPSEYILKGIVHALLGQQLESREYIKIAQQYFQLVGGSASECDTIAGRQCMATCFFLLKHFEDVLVYLSSIKTYFFNDDAFNFNFGQAKVATQAYQEAEEALLAIQSEKIRSEFCYISHLAKCYIMNKKPRAAWELYLKMETSSESFTLLQLISNDCYKTQQYYFSAKAFDVLERLDPTQEYWEGKRGACIGVFQQIYNGQEAREILRDVVNMMRGSTNPQVEYITRVMKKWARDNRVVV